MKILHTHVELGKDWATVAENMKELAAQAHPSSEDLAEGFALHRFLTPLEVDVDLAVKVHRSTTKKFEDAIQEAPCFDNINPTFNKPNSASC